MSFGFGFGFPRGGSAAAAWSPSSLFVGGVAGAWYDPSDINNYMAGLGPELVTNGNFSSSSNWLTTGNSSVSSGTGNLDGTAVAGLLYQAGIFSIGKCYQVEFDVVSITGTLKCWNNDGTTIYSTTTSGRKSFTYIHAIASSNFLFRADLGSNIASVDNVSVKQVTSIGNATMFTTSAGTTPVTMVEQNVGLILDKSQGLVLGSDVVTNGDFSGGSTGWTLGTGWAAGSGVATHTGATAGYLSQAGKVTIGKTYKITVTITASDGRGLQLIGAFWSPGVTIGSAAGTYTVYATALDTTLWLYANNAGTTLSIDNVSVNLLPGNHAYVTADANRGILRSRFNQLTYSEQFDNAAWTKSNSLVQQNLVTYSELFENAAWTKSNSFIQTNLLTYSQEFDNAAWTKLNASVVADSILAPNGTITADTVTSTNSASATAGVYKSLSYAAGHTLSIYAKANTSSIAWVSSNAGESYGVFNLATGTVIDSGNATASIAAVPGYPGWYRLIVASTTVASTYFITGGKDSYTSGHPWSNGTWTSGNSIYLWGAQLVQGSVPGDYQVTTSAAAAVAYANWDGTLTARKLCENSASAIHRISQSFAPSTTGVFTKSYYAKAGERNWFVIQNDFGSNNTTQLFNLSTGAIGAQSGLGGTANIISVGGGWYRCSLTTTTSTTTAGTGHAYVSDSNSSASYTGDGTSGIYISDSQLVQGSVPGDYRATTASALPILYTDPLGGLTAMKLCENDALQAHRIQQTVNLSGAAVTLSQKIKAGERTWAYLRIDDASSTKFAYFNLSSGAVGSVSSGLTSTITNAGGGWYVCTTTYASPVATASGVWVVGVATGDGVNTYTGDGSSGIYVWGAQLVTGSSAGTYQRIAAATDYATAGFPLYLAFDGTNDTMQSNTITFSTKYMTCVTGDSRTNNAAQRILLELSANSSVNNGSFGVYSPFATNGSYGWQRDNTVTSDNITTGGYTTLTPYVGTGIIDFTADPEASFTVDTSYNVSSLDTGASNFGNYPIYIGARAGTSLFYSGNIYQIVFLNKLLSAAELVNLQYYVATKCSVATPGTVPNTGPFYQTGPTLDLVFAGQPTDGFVSSLDSIDLNFIADTYQVAAQYMVWE